ncbi:MAG: hypothetical protein NTV01_22820 [Bacteroidia bacterium]|nr:hypothetical protein [Bacteroidia bacterium]
MGPNKPPDDRLKPDGKKSAQSATVNKSVNLKIPDKELHIMNVDEKAPDGSGTCSCNSVCTCVPVDSCSCNMVCTCDSVCSTNLCACNPFDDCNHTCSCVATCSTCCVGVYWYPN